jgi:hypothetical protein
MVVSFLKVLFQDFYGVTEGIHELRITRPHGDNHI